MKKLSIKQTIKTGVGSYWWENWETKREGGVAPAFPNAPLGCYVYYGKVWSLNTSSIKGIGGGKVSWEVTKATGKLAEYVLGKL